MKKIELQIVCKILLTFNFVAKIGDYILVFFSK
jgi:hypothetical protein